MDCIRDRTLQYIVEHGEAAEEEERRWQKRCGHEGNHPSIITSLLIFLFLYRINVTLIFGFHTKNYFSCKETYVWDNLLGLS